MADGYLDFLEAKAISAPATGFHVEQDELHPWLKPHCRAIVQWGLAGGARAYFTAYGLHKTSMQLETLRQIVKREGGPALQVAPLGVRQEFFHDAERLGMELPFIRSEAEIRDGQVNLVNYETIRDGKIDPKLFTAASLDEADVLRSYGSKTFQEFLPAFEPVRFKFVATATPSPNRYKELIHYAGFLGVMDTGQALTRFFQRNSEKANDLTLYPHKETEFWLWVSTWAIFLQRPSDICPCPCHGRNHSPDCALAGLSSESGEPTKSATAPGCATATAAGPTSPPPATSAPAASSAAAASGRSTAAKVPAPTPSGLACTPAAETPRTKTGPTTEAEGSACASVGGTSPPSSKTWDSPPPAEQSSAETTTAAMSPGTASGPTEKLRPGTPGETSSSPSTAAAKASPLGRKNSASAIGVCTVVTSSDGQPSASSRTWCDSCRCDEGYELPELEVRWHEVQANLADAGADSRGQMKLIRDAAVGVQDAAREKRDTLPARIAKLKELREAEPENHFLLWHDLEDERRAIEQALPQAKSVYGTQDLDEREAIVRGFKEGTVKDLAAKPVMLGAGGNLQAHCHRAIFAGIGHKARDIFQAWHRVQRFGQKHKVIVDMIYAETERELRRSFEAKWARDVELRDRMSEIIRKYGLNRISPTEAMRRSIGVERRQEQGERWTAVLNDCVDEAGRMASDSVGLILTSVPFGTQYEYCESYNDFGHNDDNAAFFRQMDFLTPELLRILRPGRVLAVHVKDRILFGNVTGLGFPTVEPFHADCIAHYRKHGFHLMAVRPVETDVVRENNQTYRLGYSEMRKDATKMGSGSPEYVLFFRKAQTDLARGYADDPVAKSLDEYSLARWQIDAASYWRSSGDRYMTAEELAALPPKMLQRAFRDQSSTVVYDHEDHVRLAEALAARGALPKTFAALALESPTGVVWTDILRMATLNADQSLGGREKHVCPLQIDIVDRVIRFCSARDDLVFDPFAGLGTVPVRAITLGRRGYGSELNPQYFKDSLRYLMAAEFEARQPTLFDVLDAGQSEAVAA